MRKISFNEKANESILLIIVSNEFNRKNTNESRTQLDPNEYL